MNSILKEIAREGYDHTKIFLKLDGIKDQNKLAVVSVPKFMYPNQIKKTFPTAVEFYYYASVGAYSKKGKCIGMDEVVANFIGKF